MHASLQMFELSNCGGELAGEPGDHLCNASFFTPLLTQVTAGRTLVERVCVHNNASGVAKVSAVLIVFISFLIRRFRIPYNMHMHILISASSILSVFLTHSF